VVKMIVRKDKIIETNSLFPSTDWYNEGNYVIDEAKEENQELIEKIKVNAPYMELVIKDGQIVDIVPTERPEPESVVVTEPIDKEKAFLSEAVIQLSSEIESLKQEIKTLK